MRTVTSPVGRRINSARGKSARGNSVPGNSVQHGFSYIMVMVAVMVMGISAGAGITLVSREVQADREQELLFRGMAYREAIGRYYRQTKSYPPTLAALVSDPLPGKRYMRSLYPDPMKREPMEVDKGGAEKGGPENQGWQLVRGTDGGIIGVASRSKATPLKQANFPEGYEKFADAQTYSEWIFSVSPTPSPPVKK